MAIKFREMGAANQLIEEFMLLANRRVAEMVSKLKGKHLFTGSTTSLILKRSQISVSSLKDLAISWMVMVPLLFPKR